MLKQTCEIYRPELVGYDELNTPKYEAVFFKKLKMVIVTKEIKNIKDGTQYTELKHLGLTLFKGLKKGMTLKSKSKEFFIEEVDNTTRLAQITMKEVEYDE